MKVILQVLLFLFLFYSCSKQKEIPIDAMQFLEKNFVIEAPCGDAKENEAVENLFKQSLQNYLSNTSSEETIKSALLFIYNNDNSCNADNCDAERKAQIRAICYATIALSSQDEQQMNKYLKVAESELKMLDDIEIRGRRLKECLDMIREFKKNNL